MRITKNLRTRLADLFARRMFDLGFDDDRRVATWTQYLEDIGCRRVHVKGLSDPRPPRGFVMVEDPVWYGDHIIIPRDVAIKALVVGLP